MLLPQEQKSLRQRMREAAVIMDQILAEQDKARATKDTTD